MIPGKSSQCRHFTRQNALFEKTLVLLLSRFLVDRFPVIKEMIDLTISKLYISNVPRISPSEMFDKLIILQKCHFTCQTACYFCYFCVFLLCFIKLILGNRYGPGVSSCQQTSLRQPGVTGSSPCTLTASLAIPIPSSSPSNGPSN